MGFLVVNVDYLKSNLGNVIKQLKRKDLVK